jgi:hypothetical protein
MDDKDASMDNELFDDTLLTALRDARPLAGDDHLAAADPQAERLLAEILGHPGGSLRQVGPAFALGGHRHLPMGWARQTRRALIMIAVAAVLVLVVLIPLAHSPHAVPLSPKPVRPGPEPALSGSLLVAPVWYSSCCKADLPEKPPFKLTVFDPGTGRGSTISPLPKVDNIELPWVAVGPYVVALASPPRAGFVSGGTYEAYAFEPGTSGVTTLGEAMTVLAANSGNAVWLESLRPGPGTCLQLREVTVAGVTLTGAVSLPCQASVLEVVPGGLLLQLPLIESGQGAVRIEVLNPMTGRVAWYRDELLSPSAVGLPQSSFNPAALGPRYMLTPAGTCVPGDCSEVLVTDLTTGHAVTVHFGVPLPPSASFGSGNDLPYESITTFSPSVPQDLAILTGEGYGGKAKSLEHASLRILDVLTGQVIYQRQLTLVAEPSICSMGPCPPPHTSYGQSLGDGNPFDPYVSWSWGGGYLLIGRGASQVIAYPVDSETTPGIVLNTGPDSLVVEKP